MLRSMTVSLLALMGTSAAFAADMPGRKSAPMAPAAASASCKETEKTALSTDVFGFTTGSDVSDVGAWGASATYAGAFKGGGFKPGSFSGHAGQLQVSTAFAPCWEIGPYLIGSTATGKNRGVFGDAKLDTYGVGIEQKYKIFGRATHGFGLTAGWDINYQGYDAKDKIAIPNLSTDGGQVTNSFRLFLDREIISGKLFGALNLVVDQIWFERPALVAPQNRSDHLRQSNFTLSGAVSYQLVDGLFVGGEARYVRTHLGSFLNQFTGDAIYVGPTMFWQASKSIAVSAAWGVQVKGAANAFNDVPLNAINQSSQLNLATQNQHIARAKIAYTF
ncbi:MAG: hypothetical protein ACRCWO_08740 [Bosea sp. (in: a-proteobacteria)]